MDQFKKEESLCDFYAKHLVSRGGRIERTVVDGRESILERKETIPFDIEHEEPILKGILICVPDLPNGNFFAVGRYKSEDDYRVLQKIVDSIKFTHPQPALPIGVSPPTTAVRPPASTMPLIDITMRNRAASRRWIPSG
jgi:hypothetical protein